MEESFGQLWYFCPFSRRFHSNRADYHWSVVQSSPWNFRPFNRRLIVPHDQWSSGPSYHLSADPSLYITNSRQWLKKLVEESVGVIGLSLCLSTGLLLYLTKGKLLHPNMASAIPQINIRLYGQIWVTMLFPIRIKLSRQSRKWLLCTFLSLFATKRKQLRFSF